jgi:large subunit GTPase 1
MRSGQGNPDEARSARYVLKDYINAKLLFCHPPPNVDVDAFNARTHEIALRRAEGKKHAPTTRVSKGADTYIAAQNGSEPGQGQRSRVLDGEFFGSEMASRPFVGGKAFSRSKAFPHQHLVANDGTMLDPKYARLAAVVSNQDGVYGNDKHHKKPKRAKKRSGKGYE